MRVEVACHLCQYGTHPQTYPCLVLPRIKKLRGWCTELTRCSAAFPGPLLSVAGKAGSILPDLRELEFLLHLLVWAHITILNKFLLVIISEVLTSCGFSSFLNKLSILIQEKKKQYLKLQRGSLPLSSCRSFTQNYWVE